MWRELEGNDEIVGVSADVCITTCRDEIQFRSFGYDHLSAIGVTIPPWPGPVRRKSWTAMASNRRTGSHLKQQVMPFFLSIKYLRLQVRKTLWRFRRADQGVGPARGEPSLERSFSSLGLD
jgi:hypothetical protein